MWAQMTDFIPRYFTVISPLALFVLAVVFIGSLVGWAICCYAERKR